MDCRDQSIRGSAALATLAGLRPRLAEGVTPRRAPNAPPASPRRGFDRADRLFAEHLATSGAGRKKGKGEVVMAKTFGDLVAPMSNASQKRAAERTQVLLQEMLLG